MALTYRKEIDGLRAVAVLPVILFHAGLEVFSGGYVGVDVFFVISGYLITAILIRELARGEFSLLHFYERRARRILPALFLVMLSCLPFAWWWLLPRYFAEFSGSIAATSLFISNIFFWQHTDYFGIAAESKPLLHMWSLAVEEQYYLIFPLLLMVCWPLGAWRVFLLLLVISLASLALSHWASTAMPVANFFLTPTRMWELLTGSLCAIWQHRKGRHSHNALALLGLALVLAAVFMLDKTTPFPSLYALLPVGGTALILLFGDGRTLTARLLSFRPLVAVGLISYSAYLWHQPLFAFARIHQFGEPTQAVMLALAAASLILAALSWQFVEQPFRGKAPLLPNRRHLLTLSILGLIAFAALGVWGYVQQGFEHRFSLPPKLQASLALTERSAECFQKNTDFTADDWFCKLGTRDEIKDFVLLGDSHALALLDSFDEAAKRSQQSGIFAGFNSCPPLLGVYALEGDQRRYPCHRLNQQLFDYVRAHRIPKIFLAARWAYYTQGDVTGTRFFHLGLSPDAPMTKAHSRKAFTEGLSQTVEAYREIGTQLYLIPQLPEQRTHAEELYYRLYRFGPPDSQAALATLEKLAISTQDHHRLQAFARQAFASHQPPVSILSLDEIFCKAGRCSLGTAEQSFFKDADHISRHGAMLSVSAILHALQERHEP